LPLPRPAPNQAGVNSRGRKAIVTANLLRVEGPVDDRMISRIAAKSRGDAKLLVTPHWTGNGFLLAFAETADAAKTALHLAHDRELHDRLRITAHSCVTERLRDPFSKDHVLVETDAALAQTMLSSTPSGAVYVTEDFAACLKAARAKDWRVEEVGEIDAR